MIDIVSVGNQKVAYKDHSDIKFESLNFYIDLAKKTISKFGRDFSPTLTKEMLKSEDAIANVANCIMMADWRWDENRQGETGQKKTRYSYRNQCAIWAIKSYISRKQRKKQKKHIDIQNSNYDDDFSLLDIISDNNKCPLDLLIDSETDYSMKSQLQSILDPNNKILSEKQSQYIKMYYFDNMTFAEIGKRFNITREAVRQGIKKAIEKIQSISHV